MNSWKTGAAKCLNKSFDEPQEDDEGAVQEYEEYFLHQYQNLIVSANKEFGIDCWSHSVVRQEIDCVEVKEGRYDVGISALVRIEKKNGIHHEGLGFGVCCGKKSKLLAMSIARKESILRGLSCALQCFSNIQNGMSALKVPRMSIPKSGLDEVDCTMAENKKDCLTVNQTSTSNNGFWKKTKMSVDPVPSKAETPPKPATMKAAVLNSCTTPSRSSSAVLSDSGDDEEKLERKRKQRQKQEEFRQRFKQNQPEKSPHQSNQSFQTNKQSEREKMDEMIEKLDGAEDSFISTQELNEMIQTTTKPTNANARLRRPLLSSPPQDNVRNWGPGPTTLIKADTYR